MKMRGLGEMLFGSVTVNRNRKTRKRKGGVYVSLKHTTRSIGRTKTAGRSASSIRAGDVGRVRELIGEGRRWEELEKEWERLANRQALEGGRLQKVVLPRLLLRKIDKVANKLETEVAKGTEWNLSGFDRKLEEALRKDMAAYAGAVVSAVHVGMRVRGGGRQGESRPHLRFVLLCGVALQRPRTHGACQESWRGAGAGMVPRVLCGVLKAIMTREFSQATEKGKTFLDPVWRAA